MFKTHRHYIIINNTQHILHSFALSNIFVFFVCALVPFDLFFHLS